LISDVYEGKSHPRIVAGWAPPIHLQLRGRPKTALEQRLAKLERLVRDAFLKDRRGTPVIKQQEKV
jgi:hypothetical protein